jgi:hypothetical protein
VRGEGHEPETRCGTARASGLKACTVERSRGLGWSSETASGEGSGNARPLGCTRGWHARNSRARRGVSLTLMVAAEPPET